MKKTLLILAICIPLSGCGWFSREVAKLTGYSKECIDGVMYYQFTSGVTVAYNPDGSVRACK
jgi:uncharacterized protein YceK